MKQKPTRKPGRPAGSTTGRLEQRAAYLKAETWERLEVEAESLGVHLATHVRGILEKHLKDRNGSS